MRGKRLIGTGTLALALMAGVSGPAQATTDPTSVGAARALYEEFGSGTVARAGDQVVVNCPDGMIASDGSVGGRLKVRPPDRDLGAATRYRSEPTPDRSGWIGRVESTERTKPWTLEVRVFCVAPGEAVRSGQVVVEEPGTVGGGSDPVMACCPAGTQAVSGRYFYPNQLHDTLPSGVLSDKSGYFTKGLDWWDPAWGATPILVFAYCE